MACSTVLKKGKAGVVCGEQRPVVGIEQSVMLFNIGDVKTKTLNTTDKDIIDSFELKTGKKGLEVKGFKTLITTPYEFENPDTSIGGLKHALSGLYFDPTVWEEREMVDALIAGAQVYAMIQQKIKGTTDIEQKYLFLGYNKALELSELGPSSTDTRGYLSVTLKTPGVKLEPKQAKMVKSTVATDQARTGSTGSYTWGKTAWEERFDGSKAFHTKT